MSESVWTAAADEAVTHNIADVFENGPRLTTNRKTAALAIDRRHERVLMTGLGAMGVGTMWCTYGQEDPEWAELPERNCAGEFGAEHVDCLHEDRLVATDPDLVRIYGAEYWMCRRCGAHVEPHRVGAAMTYVLFCYDNHYADATSLDEAKAEANTHIQTCPEGSIPQTEEIAWHLAGPLSPREAVSRLWVSAARGQWLSHRIEEATSRRKIEMTDEATAQLDAVWDALGGRPRGTVADAAAEVTAIREVLAEVRIQRDEARAEVERLSAGIEQLGEKTAGCRCDWRGLLV